MFAFIRLFFKFISMSTFFLSFLMKDFTRIIQNLNFYDYTFEKSVDDTYLSNYNPDYNNVTKLSIEITITLTL